MNKKTVIAVILAVIGIVGIAVGGFQLWQIHMQDQKEQALHDDLLKLHDNGGRDGDGIDQGLAALNAKNPDCIYWLRIPDTVIDYPVMYRPQDKEYYLTHDFNGDYAPSGALYLSEICDPEKSDNLIIYGHHMKSGTMFAHLEDYKSEDFYKKHKRIELETLHGHEDYEVVAAFTTPVYTGHDFEYYKFAGTDDPNEFYDYVTKCKNKSLYDTGLNPQFGQRLLTLSTCEYSQKNGRMVIVAMQVGRPTAPGAVVTQEGEGSGRQ